MPANDELRYPVGKFERPKSVSVSDRKAYIDELAAAPARLREAVRGLSDAQLDTPYRDGGWTVRQVVHHVPDSHMHAYIRFKWALTEDRPMVKTYEEALWAALPEASQGPIEPSLALLDAVHARWVLALRSLPAESFLRQYNHPEGGLMSIDEQIADYAWHARHHTAHITSLRRRKGWT